MPGQKKAKGKSVHQKAICGAVGCGFRTRDAAKMAAHAKKYGHEFRTTLRK